MCHIAVFAFPIVAVREHIKNKYEMYLYLCNKNIVFDNFQHFFAFHWLTLPCDQVHFQLQYYGKKGI